MRGAELAIRQLAGPMMELGYKMELVSYDDQNDIEVAVENAKEIVADPDTLRGVGHLDTLLCCYPNVNPLLSEN
jgi:ABC-type branched-subunit amino acid transport system substrate-binding protein